MGDLVWVQDFFFQTSEGNFFSSIRHHAKHFFLVQDTCRRVFPYKIFFPPKSVCRIFSEITNPPQE